MQGRHLSGGIFESLAFALQCVSVSLLNLVSALRMGVAGCRGGTMDLCPGGKNPRAALHPLIFPFPFTFWRRFSVAVTRWCLSTQLLYIEPG